MIERDQTLEEYTMPLPKITGLFFSCLLSLPLPAADRRAYPMDVPAGGVQTIIFDV
jgi:hypothetical protein